MILCCGEALIDMVPAATRDGNTAFSPLSGGAIFNTAIALGRLEVPVALVSGVSTDLFGQQLAGDLKASGVGTQYLVRSDLTTTLAFVQLTAGQATYTFYDEGSAGRMMTAGDMPEIDETPDAVYVGGISLCSDPCASAFEDFATGRAQTALLMIDPNIRPAFIKDEAVYRARLNRLIGQADVVKISDEDLGWIVPEASTLDARLAVLLAKTKGMVILTQGSKGARAYVAGTFFAEAVPPLVQVVDTVGAGDTFNAGFLARLSQLGHCSKDGLAGIDAQTCQDALAYAAKVAAINVTRAGANPPFLSEV